MADSAVKIACVQYIDYEVSLSLRLLR